MSSRAAVLASKVSSSRISANTGLATWFLELSASTRYRSTRQCRSNRATRPGRAPNLFRFHHRELSCPLSPNQWSLLYLRYRSPLVASTVAAVVVGDDDDDDDGVVAVAVAAAAAAAAVVAAAAAAAVAAAAAAAAVDVDDAVVVAVVAAFGYPAGTACWRIRPVTRNTLDSTKTLAMRMVAMASARTTLSCDSDDQVYRWCSNVRYSRWRVEGVSILPTIGPRRRRPTNREEGCPMHPADQLPFAWRREAPGSPDRSLPMATAVNCPLRQPPRANHRRRCLSLDCCEAVQPQRMLDAAALLAGLTAFRTSSRSRYPRLATHRPDRRARSRF